MTFRYEKILFSSGDENGNNNDLITLVQGGLVPDFWNYFIQQIEAQIPQGQRNIWDETSGGVNGFTNDKLLQILRASTGTITVNNLNDVLDEYVANDSIFTHRIGAQKNEGFKAGDRLGCNGGVKITLKVNITAATGGTQTDTLMTESRSYNLIINVRFI